MTRLERRLGKFQSAFFGIGTIVGAGIYALVGKIASQAQELSPVALLLALILASLTGYCYSRMVRLAPVAAGEAQYVFLGFNSQKLKMIIGWAVAFTGIVSCATLLRGFSGYVKVFAQIPSYIPIILCAGGLCALALKGIRESIWFAVSVTIIEILGICLVIFSGANGLMETGLMIGEISFENIRELWPGLLTSTFFAFYAFIGFEDMVNLAEEIKTPEKNLPFAIFCALAVAGLLYLLALGSAISSLGYEELGRSENPMAQVYAVNGGDPKLLALIGLFAILNGALAQIIMASRVLYGLNHPSSPLALLSKLNPKTKTPVNATVLVGGLILFFALAMPIEWLAQATSFIILLVFAMVAASLYLILKRQGKHGPSRYVAMASFFLNLGLIALRVLT